MISAKYKSQRKNKQKIARKVRHREWSLETEGNRKLFSAIQETAIALDEPYQVTPSIGGPEFETLGLLGTNLGITDPKAIAKANELFDNFGLDTISQ